MDSKSTKVKIWGVIVLGSLAALIVILILVNRGCAGCAEANIDFLNELKAPTKGQTQRRRIEDTEKQVEAEGKLDAEHQSSAMYHVGKLDQMDEELAGLNDETYSNANKRLVRKIRRKIKHVRGLWLRSISIKGDRWKKVDQRALTAHKEVERLMMELRENLGADPEE